MKKRTCTIKATDTLRIIDDMERRHGQRIEKLIMAENQKILGRVYNTTALYAGGKSKDF